MLHASAVYWGMDLPTYVTRPELAKRWRVSVRTIQAWETAGKIERARPLVAGSKVLLFRREMIERIERQGFPEAAAEAEAAGRLALATAQ